MEDTSRESDYNDHFYMEKLELLPIHPTPIYHRFESLDISSKYWFTLPAPSQIHKVNLSFSFFSSMLIIWLKWSLIFAAICTYGQSWNEDISNFPNDIHVLVAKHYWVSIVCTRCTMANISMKYYFTLEFKFTNITRNISLLHCP